MDHYNTLGVTRSASPEEIKKAYRKLAMEHHPDKGGDINKFQEISTAYEILSDQDRRFQYDNPQARQYQNIFNGMPGGFSFNVNGFDLNEMFGTAFGQRPGQPFHQQQQLFRTRVNVSLLDVFYGADQVLQLGTPNGVKPINIKIPLGIHSGASIRYENIIENGTLIIEFFIQPDLRFDRLGDDLYANFPISVLDLIVGTKTEVNTIDEKKLEVNIPPNTQLNQQIRLRGHGMTRSDGSRGDQILLLKPYIPIGIPNSIIDVINREKLTDTK
jgi:DnaJ-class molecular chaperone